MIDPATAIDLAGLVNYQPAAVVSKTIIEKQTGTVTLFAFRCRRAGARR